MDIEPCPFCGGRATTCKWFSVAPNPGPDTWRVSCVFGCGTSSAELTEENAILAWNQRKHYNSLSFFTAILLAVSEHRAKSLEVMEDFIADLKKASEQ